MSALHLFRIEFARPRIAGDMAVLLVLAVDMTSAIAAAVDHRGDSDYLGVSACMRLVQVDVVAAAVRSELVRAREPAVLS